MQKGPGNPKGPKGLIRLGIGGNGTAEPSGDNVTCDRDGYLFVPQSYQPSKPTAFLLALHDAGGNSSQPLGLLAAAANASGGAAAPCPCCLLKVLPAGASRCKGGSLQQTWLLFAADALGK